MLQQIKKAHEVRTNQKGFTLIELLLVIVILGVLSGIVVFAVGGITDRGNASACKSDVKSTEVALEAYRAKHGAYPAADAWAAITTGDDQFLKSAPASTEYAVHFTAAGAVSSTPACNTL